MTWCEVVTHCRMGYRLWCDSHEVIAYDHKWPRMGHDLQGDSDKIANRKAIHIGSLFDDLSLSRLAIIASMH